MVECCVRIAKSREIRKASPSCCSVSSHRSESCLSASKLCHAKLIPVSSEDEVVKLVRNPLITVQKLYYFLLKPLLLVSRTPIIS